MTVKENIVEEFELYESNKHTDYPENSEGTVCIVPKDTESMKGFDVNNHEKVNTVVRCSYDSIDFDLIAFTGINDDSDDRVYTYIKEKHWNRLLKCVDGETERLNPTLNTETWLPVIVEIEDCDYKVAIAPVVLNSGFGDPLNEKPDTINEVIFE